MSKNITFRTQLVGGVYEFCHETQLPLLVNALHLVELIVLLARYQEEGVSLCPKVYLTDDLSMLKAMLPDGESLKIGVVGANIDGIKQALKKCAPLATDNWLIYIQDKGDAIEYGVFKGSGNPISVLVDDVLMKDNDVVKVVKAFQIADDCVEIRSNTGAFHYIFLNHRKEDSPPPLLYLENLVKEVTRKVNADEKEQMTSFLTRLFFDALRQSHGCIIAVTDLPEAPGFLSQDAVMLEEPIDFATLVREIFDAGYMVEVKGF